MDATPPGPIGTVTNHCPSTVADMQTGDADRRRPPPHHNAGMTMDFCNANWLAGEPPTAGGGRMSSSRR